MDNVNSHETIELKPRYVFQSQSEHHREGDETKEIIIIISLKPQAPYFLVEARGVYILYSMDILINLYIELKVIGF